MNTCEWAISVGFRFRPFSLNWPIYLHLSWILLTAFQKLASLNNNWNIAAHIQHTFLKNFIKGAVLADKSLKNENKCFFYLAVATKNVILRKWKEKKTQILHNYTGDFLMPSHKHSLLHMCLKYHLQPFSWETGFHNSIFLVIFRNGSEGPFTFMIFVRSFSFWILNYKKWWVVPQIVYLQLLINRNLIAFQHGLIEITIMPPTIQRIWKRILNRKYHLWLLSRKAVFCSWFTDIFNRYQCAAENLPKKEFS